MKIKTAEDWEKYLLMITDSELVCIRNRVKWECDRRTKLNLKGSDK